MSWEYAQTLLEEGTDEEGSVGPHAVHHDLSGPVPGNGNIDFVHSMKRSWGT